MPEVEYQTQRLDHLGIVAGVCREAGIAEWLDKQAGENRRDVSVGTAVVAMILNGLGFANRQLYLVPIRTNLRSQQPSGESFMQELGGIGMLFARVHATARAHAAGKSQDGSMQ